MLRRIKLSFFYSDIKFQKTSLFFLKCKQTKPSIQAPAGVANSPREERTKSNFQYFSHVKSRRATTKTRKKESKRAFEAMNSSESSSQFSSSSGPFEDEKLSDNASSTSSHSRKEIQEQRKTKEESLKKRNHAASVTIAKHNQGRFILAKSALK